jgi:thioredoxin reductase
MRPRDCAIIGMVPVGQMAAFQHHMRSTGH